MWWKNNKWKVILPILIAAVLAGAFWYGGSAPGTSGFPASGGGSSPDNSVLASVSDPAESSQTPGPGAGPDGAAKSDGTPPDASEKGQSDEQAGPDASSSSGIQSVDADRSGQQNTATIPASEDAPPPAAPQDATPSDTERTCTLSISCASILSHMDRLDPEKAELVPEDGWVLKPISVTFTEGESVFDVLRRTCQEQKIHLEYTNTPLYDSDYIEGIHNLYEFDCGELSGWMYKVNEWFPNYGCSRYQLKDGDVICWVYTCDQGADVGGRNSVEG